MKAIQINKYGGNDVLEVNVNAPKPAPKQGQLLIENHAASINPFDGKLRAGYLQKMMQFPMPMTLGGDFTGIVSEVGEGVSGFTVGEAVYGSANVVNGGSGSLAQYVAANAANTARKPKTVSFGEAAAFVLVGVSALQALEEHMKLQRGQKILIHGGAGGIGHIAIQLAKALGAYVATTVKQEDFGFVKNLGADEVIDYKTHQFEAILTGYDAVYDTVGGKTTEKSFVVLKKGGVLVSMLGEPDQELAQKHGVTAIGQNTKTNTAHLTRLAELIDGGKLKVHIDKVFSLNEAREAFAYQEDVHLQGKLVLNIK